MLTKTDKTELAELLYLRETRESRKNLLQFTQATFKKFQAQDFHKKYYTLLDMFADKRIKNMIISMPPQHGKSEGSSRRAPAYIAGKRPDEKLALVSYAATKAQKFGREIMNIINSKRYKEIFPHVKFPEAGYRGQKANTNQERESVNSSGSMKFVGVGGPLTGDPVDILLLDDLYKDWEEGNSPVIQEKVWNWYLTVADSRLHNDSQQLIVFTRWSENDLIAKLEDKGFVVEYDGTQDLEDLLDAMRPDQFLKVNFQAIKEGAPTELDTREEGQPLWGSKHSIEKLESTRSKDFDKFDCLYQGDPVSKEGLLYTKPFRTYTDLPKLKAIKSYTDTADTGDDFLCSIVYGVPLSSSDKNLYVIDLVYTDKPMEITENLVIELLDRNNVNLAKIESNNGGRGFARVIEKGVKRTEVEWFHQNKNKEARIYSQSATVNNTIVFPDSWHVSFPKFYKDLTKYKKQFKANKHDDAPDTLTGVVEMEQENLKLNAPEPPDLSGLVWGG